MTSKCLSAGYIHIPTLLQIPLLLFYYKATAYIYKYTLQEVLASYRRVKIDISHSWKFGSESRRITKQVNMLTVRALFLIYHRAK